jgi:hypothetical protein
MSERRKGKIARLPKELRDAVNLMLLDGVTYAQIVSDLEKRGQTGFNVQNISNWHAGGYVDWLKAHERLDQLRLLRESAFDLVKDNQGTKVTDAALHLAAAQAYEVLADFDLSAFKDAMVEKPEIYPKLINGLSKISNGVLDNRKYSDACEKARVEIQKLRDPKADISDSDRLAIVNEVDRILGIK